MSGEERDRSWLKGLICQFDQRAYRKRESFRSSTSQLSKKQRAKMTSLSTTITDTATVNQKSLCSIFNSEIIGEDYEYYDEYYLDAFGRSKRRKKKKKKTKYSSAPVYVPYNYPTRQQGDSNTMCWRCHVAVSTYDYGNTDLYKVRSRLFFLFASFFSCVWTKASLNTVEWGRTTARLKNDKEQGTFTSSNPAASSPKRA